MKTPAWKRAWKTHGNFVEKSWKLAAKRPKYPCQGNLRGNFRGKLMETCGKVPDWPGKSEIASALPTGRFCGLERHLEAIVPRSLVDCVEQQSKFPLAVPE